MERAFELPIHITYRPPLWLLPALVISHVGAIICIFSLSVPPWMQAGMTTIVIAGLLWSLPRYVYNRYRTDPIRLILNTSDEWKLVDERGDRSIKLLPGAFVHPRLLVLSFRDNGRNCSFILTPSTLDEDMLRRLRVRLLFRNVKSEG